VCFAKWTERHLTQTNASSSLNNNNNKRKERECCSEATRRRQPGAGSADVLVFPRSHVEAALHFSSAATGRDVDFNFVGRVVSRQAVVTRNRKWVVDFAKEHFTNRSLYLDTTAPHRNDYKTLGEWDRSSTNGGFLPMEAMARQAKNQCAMARCDASYYRNLARSAFTLAPAGDQPWSQRFFEAILAGSVPVVQNIQHTGRSLAEKNIGYKYLLASELAARLLSRRRRRRQREEEGPSSSSSSSSSGENQQVPYCANFAKHNLDLFLRHQTLIERRQSINPGLFLCDTEAFPS